MAENLAWNYFATRVWVTILGASAHQSRQRLRSRRDAKTGDTELACSISFTLRFPFPFGFSIDEPYLLGS
jgi:hypothetical protein